MDKAIQALAQSINSNNAIQQLQENLNTTYTNINNNTLTASSFSYLSFISIILNCFTTTQLLIIGGLSVTVVYVGSLYIWSNAFTLPRDHPQQIKQRFISVAFASLYAFLYLLFFWSPYSSFDVVSENYSHCFKNIILIDILSSAIWVLNVSGLIVTTNESVISNIIETITQSILSTIVSLLLTMILFAGPLLADYLHYPYRREDYSLQCWFSKRGLLHWRTLVVCPITEEWAFRSSICPIMIAAGISSASTVFLSPLFFGAAHLHHILNRYSEGWKRMLMTAIPVDIYWFCININFVTVAVQFCYTTVFGWYSSFLLLRTGFVIGPIVAHAFCNFMELPDFGGIPSHPYSKVVGVTYVLGLITFFFALYPLTPAWLFPHQVL